MKINNGVWMTILLVTFGQASYSAEQASAPQTASTEYQLSHDVARNYPSLEAWLKSSITSSKLTADLKDWAFEPKQQRSLLNQAYGVIPQLIPPTPKQPSDQVPWQLRLASPDMIKAWQEGQSPLFAYEPEGEEADWRYVEAFDIDGNTHLLNIDQIPDRPVFVVERNQRAEMQAGLKLANELLKRSTEMIGPSTMMASSLSSSEVDEYMETTVLKSIYVEDIQEPWILGKAEVYALVTGIDADTDQAVLRLIDLPYLQEDKITYEPNQVLIHWGQYRWGAVDVTLMEHDKNTDYKVLASDLLKAVSEAMKLIPSESLTSYIAVIELTNLMISAMPNHWLVNNDDYIDTFYTVLKDQETQVRMGARGNAEAVFTALAIQKI